ncbi:MAG: hypothetical protein MHM6MM_000029 [Cercozoa sp. M6MM]
MSRSASLGETLHSQREEHAAEAPVEDMHLCLKKHREHCLELQKQLDASLEIDQRVVKAYETAVQRLEAQFSEVCTEKECIQRQLDELIRKQEQSFFTSQAEVRALRLENAGEFEIQAKAHLKISLRKTRDVSEELRRQLKQRTKELSLAKLSAKRALQENARRRERQQRVVRRLSLGNDAGKLKVFESFESLEQQLEDARRELETLRARQASSPNLTTDADHETPSSSQPRKGQGAACATRRIAKRGSEVKGKNVPQKAGAGTLRRSLVASRSSASTRRSLTHARRPPRRLSVSSNY